MRAGPDHSDECPDPPVRAPGPHVATLTAPDWTADPAPDVRAPLTITAAADGHAAAQARQAFAAWLGIDVADAERVHDLVLAVYETLANVAEHAYREPSGPGPLLLRARRSRTALHVTVSDHGHWRTPVVPVSAPAVRGRGLPLIRMIVEDVHVEPGSGGTTVHLRAPLPPPARCPGASR